MYVACALVLFANVGVETNSININYSKDELINILKTLLGGDNSALPDFLFFSQESLDNYTISEGPPRNRTELRRKKRPRARNRSEEEVTLGRALRDLQKGRNVEKITRFAQLLRAILYDKDYTEEFRDCLYEKTVGDERLLRKSISKCNRYSRKCNRNHRRCGKKKNSEKRKRDYMYENEDDEENEIEEISPRFKRAIINNEPQSYNPLKYINVLEKQRYLAAGGGIQTADFVRMRRSLSYTYVSEGTCFDEGTTASTSDTVYLCNVCYKTINFGDGV